jgi:hypothetical protein
MREKSFLSVWCSSFAAVFLLGAAGLTFWSLSFSDPREKVLPTILSAVCAVGGATLGLLGMAFARIQGLERRLREIERRTPDIPNRETVP